VGSRVDLVTHAYLDAEIEVQPGRYDLQLDLNRGGTPSYSAMESDLDVDWGVDVTVSLMP